MTIRLSIVTDNYEIQLNLCELDGHSQKDQHSVFNTNYRLMQVKSITECSTWSILQYFRPSLSYQLLLRSLFCLVLSCRFTHVPWRVILYVEIIREVYNVASGLSPIQADNHDIAILYHLHQCRPCTLRDISRVVYQRSRTISCWGRIDVNSALL